MQHQSGKDFEFTERLVSVINVFKVTATSFTGKEESMEAERQPTYL